MVIKFDIFGDAKTPKITLHNPNGQQVGIISEFKDMEMNINLMELSTLSFSVPHNNLFYDEVFDKLKRPRIIKVDGIGRFIVDEPTETNDGITKWKHVVCKSLEYELSRVTVRILEGIYKFYDVVNPSETILGKIMSYLPNWKLGSVDSDLWNVKRMFVDTTETAYSMLMGGISDTFKCVFRFNTLTRTIDVKKYENMTKNTDVVVGYSNLVKSLEIGESPDGMFTCLNVVGAGDISINEVNPLGTSKIYNYDYYLSHTDKDGQYLMSSGLRNAVVTWKTKAASNTQTYKNVIASIKTANSELINLNQQLTTLNKEYIELETIYKVRYEDGQPISEVRQQMYDKEDQIAAKEIEVANKKTQLENLMKQKSDINKSLSITNPSNFTQIQQEELALFTNEDSYSDEHLCITDTMTENEKMEVYQELYDKAMGILSEVSQPIYSFSTSLVNYLMLGEYEAFTQQTDLGCVIRLEVEKGRFVYPILLGYTLSFDKDKRSNVDMNWGSTLRLTNDANSIKKLLDKAVSGGNKVGLDSSKWNGYEKDKSAISDYMKGSLDASVQEIKNADNQEIVFGANGIIGRKSNGDGTYSPEAFWMMNNTWVMTDDDFQTAKMAIGRILLPDGVTKAYGINTEILMGKMVVSNQLHIENESNTFKVDTNGATLLNADFTIENAKNKLLLSPTTGIKIQKKNGSVFEDKFYADVNGDLILKGTIYATNGQFSGTVSASTITGSTINGGTINASQFVSGKFNVDTSGNVVANNLKLLGGELNLNNLVVNGTISFANLPEDVASLGDVPTNSEIAGIAKQQIPSYITSTKITSTTIESPTISGNVTNSATFNGGIYKTWARGVNGGQLDNEGLRLYNGTTQISDIGYTNTNTEGNTNALLIQSLSNYALKINASGDMSLSSGGSIWMGSNVRLKSGVKIYDSTGQEVGSGGGVAVFG